MIGPVQNMRRRVRFRRHTHTGCMKWVLLGVYICVCTVFSILPADLPYSESLRVHYFLSMAHMFAVPLFKSALRAKPVRNTTGGGGKPATGGGGKPDTGGGGKPATGGGGKPATGGGKPAPGTAGQSGSSAGKAGNPADICLW